MNEAQRNNHTETTQKHPVAEVWNPTQHISEDFLESRKRAIEHDLYMVLPDPIQTIVRQIAEIEQETFGRHAAPENRIEEDLMRENGTTILLYDSSDHHTVIGYVFAVPVEDVYNSHRFYADRQIRPHTAYITNTAIKPEYQGQHLVGSLMEKLGGELKQRGYTHIERDSADGDYAHNVRKNNKDKIEEESPHDSPVGTQVYFRMKI